MTNIPIAFGELVDVPCLAELARAHWRKSTSKALSNSTATTDMLNGEITIDANAMGTNRTLVLTAKLTTANTFGSTAAPRWSIALGGTTVIDTNSIAAGYVSGTVAWLVHAEITNTAANVQTVSINIQGGGNTGASVQGSFITGTGGYTIGAGASSGLHQAAGMATAAVDTTVANLLELKVKFGDASPLLSAALYDAYAYVI